MEEDGVIEIFVPVAEEYNFHFDKDTCHYLAKGGCPVEELKEEIMKNEVVDAPCKCVRLIQSIIHDGFIERNRESWIEISKDEKGKLYEISNGRHRICAASKLNVPIKAHVYIQRFGNDKEK